MDFTFKALTVLFIASMLSGVTLINAAPPKYYIPEHFHSDIDPTVHSTYWGHVECFQKVIEQKKDGLYLVQDFFGWESDKSRPPVKRSDSYLTNQLRNSSH